jgi:hypothetical protein
MAGAGLGQKIYVMNFNLKGSGLGVCILDTINQIRYCRRENLIPVAKYDATSESHFFDPAYGNSMWEQYFEPVGPYSVADIEALLRDPGSPISEADLVTLPRTEMLKVFEEHPDSVYSWPYAGWRYRSPADVEAWFAKQCEKARQTVSESITPKPHIRDQVDRFWHQNLGDGFVLGVHIRGTDFHYAPPVSPAEYFASIDAWIERQPDLRLFVATDQIQYLDVLRNRYPQRVVSRDCIRSDNEVAPFKMDASPYQKGEDVLLDILTLARCHHLLRGASHVGAMAMYFGPNLSCTDLSLGKTKAFGQDYGRLWSYDASRPAWTIVSQSRLDAVAKHAASQSLWQQAVYAMRSISWALIRRFRRLVGF